MDNPQHYQPLSHALSVPHPHPQSRTSYSSAYTPPAKSSQMHQGSNEDLEQDDEEQDDDDEGVVEDQLHETEDTRNGSAAPTPPTTMHHQTQHPVESTLQIVHETSHTGEHKRRPGRPRGSKNKKPRAAPGANAAAASVQQAQVPGITGPPPHPEITPQNQQYYEFQWRILNLCAEFYGAAEDLVKATNPLVIAQCYHMGPTMKLDPLVMLADAKRNCDALLANPSALVANPPPPMYPALPTLYSSGHGIPPGPSVVTLANPQSFVVPLAPGAATSASVAGSASGASAIPSQPGFPPPPGAYPMYAAPPGAYPPNSYYQYSYTAPPPGAAYFTQPVASSSSGSGTGTAAAVSITTVPAAQGVHSASGAWTDDEVERLKKLAEDSKNTTLNPNASVNGEYDWEYVVRNFGDKRTRHQILIKATTMGMKESSTRGVKRRRENEGLPETAGQSTASPAMASLSQPPSTSSPAPPTHGHASSVTPHDSNSPSLQSQRPTSAAATTSVASATPTTTAQVPPAPVTAKNMPWPMPTVAVNTVSPILSSSSVMQSSGSAGSEQQRTTSYYRPRPGSSAGGGQEKQQPHPFLYQGNGHSGRGDSR